MMANDIIPLGYFRVLLLEGLGQKGFLAEGRGYAYFLEVFKYHVSKHNLKDSS